MADPRSRREFMGLTVAGAAGAFAPSLLGASSALQGFARSAAIDPELVVVNAKVFTMERAQPVAQAFAHGIEEAQRHDRAAAGGPQRNTIKRPVRATDQHRQRQRRQE